MSAYADPIETIIDSGGTRGTLDYAIERSRFHEPKGVCAFPGCDCRISARARYCVEHRSAGRVAITNTRRLVSFKLIKEIQKMALDVYFRHDVANNISSIACAMLSSAAASGGQNVEYCRGIVDTVRSQAMSFGIEWGEMSASLSKALVDARRADLAHSLLGANPE